MSELKREAALREVSIKAVTVNDDDDLDALLGGGMLEETEIAKITNMLLDNLDDVEAFTDNWGVDMPQANNEVAELRTERDSLQKELEDLRSQHQFECEYVDQLEQEITSIANDRDRQVSELTDQVEKLQNRIAEQPADQPQFDDQDLSDRLAIHVLQLEEEFHHRLEIALEIETKKITHKYLQEINEKVEIINQLQCQNTALEISQQTLTEELETTHNLLKESTKTIEIAQTKLLEATTQREQMEGELIKHLGNQAKLHQSLRGLENEYVSDLTRVQDLEQQIEDLQEQVLRQASKAAEYEAAIQHWKEQSVRHQHHALQLSGALDRLLNEKPVRHLTEPVNHPSESHSDREYLQQREAEPRQVRSPFPTSKVDLPAFLVRHR
ncbi:MAG: hypothetical protein DCF19_14780 [Pseudanabaena frigida]|uniref:Uncharacterized protein n=1 Tax=Pseudanabaena frigida TaxID=945775 RepID=A0A2W4Y7K1_9CYAN|nr:MAG: hypothetical protein DCF19_14780 [Pseudanabaena frigida]